MAIQLTIREERGCPLALASWMWKAAATRAGDIVVCIPTQEMWCLGWDPCDSVAITEFTASWSFMSRFAISEFTACRPLGKRDWSWGWRFLQTTWSSQEPSPILLQVLAFVWWHALLQLSTQGKDLLHHVSRTMKREELFFFKYATNKQTTNSEMRSFLLMEDFLHHSTRSFPTIYNILSIPSSGWKWWTLTIESDLRYRLCLHPLSNTIHVDEFLVANGCSSNNYHRSVKKSLSPVVLTSHSDNLPLSHDCWRKGKSSSPNGKRKPPQNRNTFFSTNQLQHFLIFLRYENFKVDVLGTRHLTSSCFIPVFSVTPQRPGISTIRTAGKANEDMGCVFVSVTSGLHT